MSKRSKRISIVITVIVVIILIVISPLKNFLAKKIIVSRLKKMTALGLSIGGVDLSITKGWIDIKNIEIFNPSEFIGQVMIDIPQIYIDYALNDLLNEKIYISDLKIKLKTLNIVKNAKGELNLNLLNVPYEETGEEASRENGKNFFQIDTVDLNIEKVTYKDYSRGPKPRVFEFDLNINQRYEDIKKPSLLTGLILHKIFLSNIRVAKLVYPDIAHLREEIAQAIKEADALSAEEIEESPPDESEKKSSEHPEKIVPLGVK